MSETRYMISEAAKITQVEAHVLRYWEEELRLPIGRNEMGHRYYTEKDIRTFQEIKELKKKGLQLRAIREKVHQEEQKAEEVQELHGKDELPRVIVMKPQRFHSMERGQAVSASAVDEKKPDVDKNQKKKLAGEKQIETLSEEKTKEERFGEIMERLIREVSRSERKEGRYRRLDEAIRRHQQSRKMVAATEENTKKKSRRKNR